MTTYFNPPKNCDVCKEAIVDSFADAKLTRFGGVWGNVCIPCAAKEGVQYGLGTGQRYQKQGELFYKVEG